MAAAFTDRGGRDPLEASAELPVEAPAAGAAPEPLPKGAALASGSSAGVRVKATGAGDHGLPRPLEPMGSSRRLKGEIALADAQQVSSARSGGLGSGMGDAGGSLETPRRGSAASSLGETQKELLPSMERSIPPEEREAAVQKAARAVGRAILEREGLLGRFQGVVTKMTRDSRRPLWNPPSSSTLYALKQQMLRLRVSTVKVLETVDVWQQAQGLSEDERPPPYMWRTSVNYVGKIENDADFIADCEPLVRSLGVEATALRGNPLMLPEPLFKMRAARRTGRLPKLSMTREQTPEAPEVDDQKDGTVSVISERRLRIALEVLLDGTRAAAEQLLSKTQRPQVPPPTMGESVSVPNLPSQGAPRRGRKGKRRRKGRTGDSTRFPILPGHHSDRLLVEEISFDLRKWMEKAQRTEEREALVTSLLNDDRPTSRVLARHGFVKADPVASRIAREEQANKLPSPKNYTEAYSLSMPPASRSAHQKGSRSQGTLNEGSLYSRTSVETSLPHVTGDSAAEQQRLLARHQRAEQARIHAAELRSAGIRGIRAPDAWEGGDGEDINTIRAATQAKSVAAYGFTLEQAQKMHHSRKKVRNTSSRLSEPRERRELPKQDVLPAWQPPSAKNPMASASVATDDYEDDDFAYLDDFEDEDEDKRSQAHVSSTAARKKKTKRKKRKKKPKKKKSKYNVAALLGSDEDEAKKVQDAMRQLPDIEVPHARAKRRQKRHNRKLRKRVERAIGVSIDGDAGVAPVGYSSDGGYSQGRADVITEKMLRDNAVGGGGSVLNAAQATLKQSKADEEAAVEALAQLDAGNGDDEGSEVPRQFRVDEPVVRCLGVSCLELAALAEPQTTTKPVALLCSALLMLLTPGKHVPKDMSWPSTRVQLSSTPGLLAKVSRFDPDEVPLWKLRAVRPLLTTELLPPAAFVELPTACRIAAFCHALFNAKDDYREAIGRKGVKLMKQISSAVEKRRLSQVLEAAQLARHREKLVSDLETARQAQIDAQRILHEEEESKKLQDLIGDETDSSASSEGSFELDHGALVRRGGGDDGTPRKTRRQLQAERDAAAKKARDKAENEAALKIQSHGRRAHARKRVQEKRDALKQKKNTAATNLQRVHRGNAARKELAERKAAATRIQSIQRRNAAKKKVDAKRQQADAATKIQSVQRGKVARARVAKIREENRQAAAATKIQARHRGAAGRRRFDAAAQQQRGKYVLRAGIKISDSLAVATVARIDNGNKLAGYTVNVYFVETSSLEGPVSLELSAKELGISKATLPAAEQTAVYAGLRRVSCTRETDGPPTLRIR